MRKKNLFLLNTASNVDYRWNKYLKDKTIYVIEKNRDRRAEKGVLKTSKSCAIRKIKECDCKESKDVWPMKISMKRQAN